MRFPDVLSSVFHHFNVGLLVCLISQVLSLFREEAMAWMVSLEVYADNIEVNDEDN